MNQEQNLEYRQNSTNLQPNIARPEFNLGSMELQRLAKTIKGEAVKQLGLNQKDSNKKPAEELAYASLDTTIRLANICGKNTQNRSQMTLLAKLILSNQSPTILAPSCPDFTNTSGRYDFTGLNSDIPMLAKMQIKFIQKIREILPSCKPIILIADLESEDVAMLSKLKIDKAEFARRVEGSYNATKDYCKQLGIEVKMMTNFIPNLQDCELEFQKKINNTNFESRIDSETHDRAKMYYKINSHFTSGQMRERTIRTASQYMALGQFTSENKYIVANHTTTNLNYYSLTNTPLLHNPISIY